MVEGLEERRLMTVRVWDGGAISNNWSSAANWVGNVSPLGGDDLVFPGGDFDKSADNDFADSTNFNSITLGGGYTLRGNRIFLGAGGVVDNSGTSNIIKNDLDLGSGSALRSFQTGASSTLFIDGKIRGENGLAKRGAGNLSLRASNSYVGLTDIAAGSLFIEKDESLGSPIGGTQIRTAATLIFKDTALGFLRVDEPITTMDGATIRVLDDVVLDGSINMLGTTNIMHESNQTYAALILDGALSGPGGVNFQSGRSIMRNTLSNTYQGITKVVGQLALNSSVTAIPGDLTIFGGGRVTSAESNQIIDSATVTIISSGVWDLNSSDETITSLNMVGGTVTGDGGTAAVLLGELFNLDFNPELTVLGQIEATSFSTSLPAIIRKLILPVASRTLMVSDGPADEDLILAGEYLPFEVTKAGAGTLSNYTNTKVDGNYTVNQGVVRFRNKREGTRVTVLASGKFESDQSIAALTVNAEGRVHPGSPSGEPGKLKIFGNLLLNPGAILEATLNGPVAGTGHDQLDVEGSVKVADAVLVATLGQNVNVGQQYRLINNDATDAVIGRLFVPPTTAPFLIAQPTGQRLAFNYFGGLSNNDLVLTLANTPPMAPNLKLDRTVIEEGQYVTATGSLTDPDKRDSLRLTVDWGDGTAKQTYRPGQDPFALRHRYHNDGRFIASFEWLDQHNAGNNRQFTVIVKNLAPNVSLGPDRIAASDRFFALGMIHDPGDDPIQAWINYGDHTGLQSIPIQNGRYTLNHRYLKPGNYTLTVTARDNAGAERVFKRVVKVLAGTHSSGR